MREYECSRDEGEYHIVECSHCLFSAPFDAWQRRAGQYVKIVDLCDLLGEIQAACRDGATQELEWASRIGDALSGFGWRARPDAIDQQPQEIERLEHQRDRATQALESVEHQRDALRARCDRLTGALEQIAATTKNYPNGSREGQVAIAALRGEQKSRTRLLEMALEQAIECIEHTTSMPVEAALAWFKKVLRGEV